MKMNAIGLPVLGLLLLVSSCAKNPAKKYSGDYYFTTQASSYIMSYYADTTVNFSGTVTALTNDSIKIEYAPETHTHPIGPLPTVYIGGIVYARVDEEGNLSNADYTCTHCSFSGAFDDDGNVDLSFGYHALGGGNSQTIHGTKVK